MSREIATENESEFYTNTYGEKVVFGFLRQLSLLPKFSKSYAIPVGQLLIEKPTFSPTILRSL